MKAIKIDVVSKSIYEVELSNDYKDIYKFLECDVFTCISTNTLPDSDVVYIDDEGLLKDSFYGAFSIKGYAQVLSGHGLIIGTDDSGESISCSSTVEMIMKLVRFEDIHYLPQPGFTVRKL